MATSTAWSYLVTDNMLDDDLLSDPQTLTAAARAATRDRDTALATILLDKATSSGTGHLICEPLAWFALHGSDTDVGVWLAAAGGDEPSFEHVWRRATRAAARVHAAERTANPTLQHLLADDRSAKVRAALLRNRHLHADVAPRVVNDLPRSDSNVPQHLASKQIAHLSAAATAAVISALPDDRSELAYWVAATRGTPTSDDPISRALIHRVADRSLAAPTTRIHNAALLAAALTFPDDAADLDPDTLHHDRFDYLADVVDAHRDLRSRRSRDRPIPRDVLDVAFGASSAAHAPSSGPPYDLPFALRLADAPSLTANAAARLLAHLTNRDAAAGLVARFGVDALIGHGAGAHLWRLRTQHGAGGWWPAGGDAALGAWMAAAYPTGRGRAPNTLSHTSDARLLAATLPRLAVRDLLDFVRESRRVRGDGYRARDQLIIRALARVDELGDDAAALASDFDGTTDTLAATTAALTGPS